MMKRPISIVLRNPSRSLAAPARARHATPPPSRGRWPARAGGGAPTIGIVPIVSEGRCAVFREPIGPAGVKVEDRPRTGVRDGHVAIAIQAAALNHLDLWMTS